MKRECAILAIIVGFSGLGCHSLLLQHFTSQPGSRIYRELVFWSLFSLFFLGDIFFRFSLLDTFSFVLFSHPATKSFSAMSFCLIDFHLSGESLLVMKVKGTNTATVLKTLRSLLWEKNRKREKRKENLLMLEKIWKVSPPTSVAFSI